MAVHGAWSRNGFRARGGRGHLTRDGAYGQKCARRSKTALKSGLAGARHTCDGSIQAVHPPEPPLPHDIPQHVPRALSLRNAEGRSEADGGGLCDWPVTERGWFATNVQHVTSSHRVGWRLTPNVSRRFPAPFADFPCPTPSSTAPPYAPRPQSSPGSLAFPTGSPSLSPRPMRTSRPEQARPPASLDASAVAGLPIRANGLCGRGGIEPGYFVPDACKCKGLTARTTSSTVQCARRGGAPSPSPRDSPTEVGGTAAAVGSQSRFDNRCAPPRDVRRAACAFSCRIRAHLQWLGSASLIRVQNHAGTIRTAPARRAPRTKSFAYRRSFVAVPPAATVGSVACAQPSGSCEPSKPDPPLRA